MQTEPRSKSLGLLAAVLSVAAITGVIFPLRHAVPAVSTGVLYLLGVLLVSSYWGLALGLITSLASATAFNFFHIPPYGHFTISNPQNWVALGVFFAAAVVASTLAHAARVRTLEAEERGREADLAADLARLILGSSDSAEGLPRAAGRIADTVGLESAAIELNWEGSDERRVAIPLVDDGARVGTLLVPRGLTTAQRARLDERVVPPLTAVVAAALRRAQLEDQVVETRALRRSDELKTALLRMVSHDLRSPLTAIRTAALGVGSPTLAQPDREEIAAVIADESERLSRLVDNLLDLSRLEAGTAEPNRDWCSIDEVVRSAASGIADPAAQLDIALDADLPLLQADSGQLERALVNVLENAVRHSSGQPVSVRAHASARRVIVRVTDRGPGIAKADLQRIFDPFYRADGEPGKGSGLGLAIARGFVEANGGRLRAQSLPDQGAAFLFDLPLPENVPAHPIEAKS
jgi:two-component system sensor histidine kinase KdpD